MFFIIPSVSNELSANFIHLVNEGVTEFINKSNLSCNMTAVAEFYPFA